MIKMGVMDCLCQLVNSHLPNIILIGLEGLENLMRHGKEIASQEGTENKIVIELETRGVISRIDKLQENESTEVYEKALKIIEEHYEVENIF